MEQIRNEKFDLQLFADAGSVVNTTVSYVNASTGSSTAFSGANDLAPEMKEFYDTELLENYRVKEIFSQFGRKVNLPAHHKGSVQFRKINTFDPASQLVEGVLPSGQKMGFTTVTGTVYQYGTYVTVSDKLELRAYDDIIGLATNEMSASMLKTMEKLTRDALLTGTNVLYCDNVDPDTGAYVSTPSACSAMEAGGVYHSAAASKGASTGITAVTIDADDFGTAVDSESGKYTFTYDSTGTTWKLNGTAVDLDDFGITATGTAASGDSITVKYASSKPYSLLTCDMVQKAALILEKNDAPKIDGYYVAVVHPSVANSLMRDPAWVEVNKYTRSDRIFKGEIGALYGVRFIRDNFAPILGRKGLNAAGDDAYVNKERGRTYATYFFGEDAFAIISPEGGGAEMIIHDKDEIGGPLNQFSTIGYKFETNGATILYPERILRVMSCSGNSATDTVN